MGEQRETAAGTAPAIGLFLAFLRLGLTAFGGPAMVAHIRDLAVHKKRWLSEDTFQDGAALCQSIPGATAMQTATYVGLRAGGPPGALAAFVGFGLPAFVLMLALSAAYQAGRDLQPVLSVLHGLHLLVIAIIVNAAISFGRASLAGWRDLLLAAAAAVFLVSRGNPILAIVAAAALATLLYSSVDLPEAKEQATSKDDTRRLMRLAALLVLFVAAALVALFFLEPRLFGLATVMLKVDLFAFGGGFASVPQMSHEVVDVRHWLDSRTFMDGIALGQVTPGPVVITATFVGYQVAGLSGAVVATLAIFSPSFFMVLATVPFFDRLRKSILFRRALRGVLASFVGLLFAVAVNFSVSILWSVPAVIVALAAFVALRLKVDILWVVLVGAAISALGFY